MSMVAVINSSKDFDLGTLCTHYPEDQSILSVKPSDFCPIIAPRAAMSRLYSNQQPLVNCMDPAGRFLLEANSFRHVQTFFPK